MTKPYSDIRLFRSEDDFLEYGISLESQGYTVDIEEGIPSDIPFPVSDLIDYTMKVSRQEGGRNA